MKFFNRWKTLLAVALVAAVVGAPLLYFAGKAVVGRRIQRWHDLGVAAAKAGDHERASEMLLRYLNRRPADTDALRAYVASREVAERPDGQHLVDTAHALKLLVQQDGGKLDDRRHLLELYVRLGQRNEALEAAEAILGQTKKSDLRALELKTDVLTSLGRDRDALEAARDWQNKAPGDVKSHISALLLRARLGQSQDAILQEAQRLLDTNPSDPRFEMLQGVAHALVGQETEARQWLEIAAKHEKLDPPLAHLLVTQLDRVGMAEQSLGVLEKLVAGGAADARDALARRYWELGRWEEATRSWKDLDPQDPKSDATSVALDAIALSNLKRADEAKARRAALAGRKQAVAAQAWDLLLGRLVDSAEVDNRQVLASCRAALALDPQNVYLDYYYGDSALRSGELDAAIGAWRRAWVGHPGWNVPAVRLTEALLQKGQADLALFVSTTAAKRDPRHAATLVVFARAWAAAIDAGVAAQPEELLKLVDEIQGRLPGEEQTLTIRARLIARRGDKAKAQEVIRAALGRTPPPGETALLVLSAVSREFDLGLEQQCFDASEKAHGLTPTLAGARAVEKYIVGGDPAAGLKLLDDAVQRAAPQDAAAMRLQRARYLEITNHPDARANWVQLGDMLPNDLAVQQAAAAARSARTDPKFVARTIERLRALTGDDAIGWRLAQARFLVESGGGEADYIEASKQLNELIARHRELAEPHVLLGRALAKLNRVDGAIEQLGVASKIDQGSVPIALELAALLQGRGDFERVRQELDRVARLLRSPAQRRQAALLLAQQGEAARAVQLLEEQAAGVGGTQADALLASLYRRSGQFDKADAVVQQLLKKPDLSAIDFAVAHFLALGRRDEAEKALAKLDAIPHAPEMKDLAWGSYYAQAGDVAKAVERYQSAVKANSQNPAAWRVLVAAQLATGKLADAKASADAAAAAVPSDKGLATIREQFALLADASRQATLRPLALSVIRAPVGSETAIELLRAVADARASAEAAAALPARLQQLIERNPRFLPARVQLIQAHWDAGRRGDAINVGKQAVREFANDALPAKMLVELAAADQRWQEVQSAAAVWKARAPEEGTAADVAAARALIGQRQFDAAATQLKPYVAAAMKDPDRNANVVVTYATAVANTSNADAAANLVWPLAEKAPNWRVRWVQVALGTSDTRQAAEWLDRVEKIMPPGAAQERVVLADGYDRLSARTAERDARLTRKATEVYQQVAGRPDASATALMAAASQADSAGEVKAAEGYYRRALSKDQNLYVAYNNLASLLVANKGDLKEATAFAAAAIKLQPKVATLYDTMATVRSKAGDAPGALENMRTAVGLEPDNITWRVRLAQYLLDAGDVSGAAREVAAIDERGLNSHSIPPGVQQQLAVVRRQIRGAKST